MFLDVLSHLFYAWNQPKIYVIWIESLNLVVDTVFVRAAPQFFFSSVRLQKLYKVKSGRGWAKWMEVVGEKGKASKRCASYRIVSKWNRMKIDCTYVEQNIFQIIQHNAIFLYT